MLSVLLFAFAAGSSALADSPWEISSLGLNRGIASSSENACTEMACAVDGISLEAQEHYLWLPGLYRFELLLDSRKISCEARLPLQPCGDHSVQCNEKEILVEDMGCALPAGTHAFGRILVKAYPASISLELFRDNVKIGGISTNPVYSESRPNGPRCDPLCKQATLKIELH